MKKYLKILGIVALVVAILAVAATITFAQDDPESSENQETEQAPFMGHYGRGFGLNLDNGSMLDTLASELDMTVDEILTELEQGISIADLANNHNVDVDSLIDALVSKARELITEQVSTPWESRGYMDRSPRQGFSGMPGMPGMRGNSILNSLAEALDMTVQEVMEELQTGISIADLATEHDVDLNEIVDAYLAQYQEQLDQAVENGRIDQEQADTMMQEMTDRIDEMVQTPWTENSFGPGAPCGRPGGMRGGNWQGPNFNNDGTDTQGSGFNSHRGTWQNSGSTL